MIRADIETEVSPIVGNEKQSEEMINYLLQEFEGDTKAIWQSNIFGKSFHELVSEDLNAKKPDNIVAGKKVMPWTSASCISSPRRPTRPPPKMAGSSLRKEAFPSGKGVLPEPVSGPGALEVERIPTRSP